MKKKELLLMLSFVCTANVFAANDTKLPTRTESEIKSNSKVTAAADTAGTNIAPQGTGYRWASVFSPTDNSGDTTNTVSRFRIADIKLVDGDVDNPVRLNEGRDAFQYQAAGVIFNTLQSGITSIAFVQADVVSAANTNGCFTSELSSQYTVDGETWIQTGWTISPDYPYDNSMAYETFTFSGEPLPVDILGIRITGRIFKDRQGETSMVSWEAGVNEVMVYKNAVVPISLSKFTGESTAEGNKLTWVTKSEKNNQKFEVLSSVDGNGFSVIGTVNSKAVGGNSNEDLIYTFTDGNTSDTYYILKQVDFDGTSTSSSIIFVNNGLSGASADVYPNPTSDYLNVSLSAKQAGKINITLTSTSGQRVYSEGRNIDKGKSTFRISLVNRTSGIYLLSITDEKGGSLVRRSITKK